MSGRHSDRPDGTWRRRRTSRLATWQTADLRRTDHRLPATGYRLSVTATDVASVSPMREGTRTR